MQVDGTFSGGRYSVRTVSFEMRMSHWIDAPIVEDSETGTAILDLSGDLWDLTAIQEEGEDLALIMRKYPGVTNDVEVRVLPEPDRFRIAGQDVSRQELLAALKGYR